MQFKLFFLLPVAIACFNAHGQSDFTTAKNNNLYVELGGNGHVYSINYEHLINLQFALHAGLEVFPYRFKNSKSTFIAFPIAGSKLYGNGNNKFEIGRYINRQQEV